MQTADAAFTGSSLSPHLARSPEGFLICMDVCVCRTAVHTPQYYMPSEVGITGDGWIPVYRLPSEVLSKRFLSSLEGKPVCMEHPSQPLDGSNFQNYTRGVLINPRVGPTLDSGETSVICDVMVFDEALAEMIENNLLREVSIGYACRYEKFKNGYQQTGLLANHLAVVSKGRAGHEVRIMDSKPDVTAPAELIQQVRSIVAGVKRERQDEDTGKPTGSFRDALRACNPAYKSFDDDAAAARTFADEAKKAGQEMQQRYRQCARDAAPLRQHAAPSESEDFFQMAARAGRRMRGGR